MAKGSEPLTWRNVGNAKRECAFCGKKLRIQDIGEHRKNWRTGETVIWCTEHRGGRA